MTTNLIYHTPNENEAPRFPDTSCSRRAFPRYRAARGLGF